ncbi:MAG: efflux RND transporter periplasmic adaptor subunit [Myxococcota bacterium]|nr:efflux RND transporter periplasmic adaptor subunit [Myxococcota bacterium]
MRDLLQQPWVVLVGTALFVVLGLVAAPAVVKLRAAPEPAPADSLAAAALDLSQPRVRRVRGEPRPELPEAPATEPDAEPDATTTGRRRFDCMIVPYEVLDIGSAVTGVLDEVHAERSDYVEEGQVLARLEASVEEAAVRAARAVAERTVDVESQEASLELGEIRRARARELFERDALSLDTRQEADVAAALAALELQRAREDRRVAALRLEQAEAALKRRSLLSPISGFVVERRMGRGEVVVEEDTVFRLAQVDPLRVEAILPSDWFGRVQPGDLAAVVPEGPGDEEHTAEVEIVDPVIDGASGTFGVLLRLPNPSRELPAGLRCELAFGDGVAVTSKAAPAQ